MKTLAERLKEAKTRKAAARKQTHQAAIADRRHVAELNKAARKSK